MSRRIFRWWFLAEDICSRLTRPPTDLAASDRHVERLLVASKLWSFGAIFTGKARAAWLESRLRSWTRAAANAWPSSDLPTTLTAIGWTMTFAAVTTLIVQAVRPSGIDPVDWAVPAAVALAGLVLPWMANGVSGEGASGKS